MVTFFATENEISLIEDIEEVGYGELYNLDHTSQPATQQVEITYKTQTFLKALRIIQKVSRLIVHDSEPALLEYRGVTEHGRRCLKKMKF
jgi:hypothetical protein